MGSWTHCVFVFFSSHLFSHARNSFFFLRGIPSRPLLKTQPQKVALPLLKKSSSEAPEGSFGVENRLGRRGVETDKKRMRKDKWVFPKNLLRLIFVCLNFIYISEAIFKKTSNNTH